MTEVEVPRNKISHSEAELFDKCKKAHYYSYGLGIMGMKESDALVRGIVGHALLREYFLGLKEGRSVKEMKRELLLKILPTVDAFEVYDTGKLAQELMNLFTDYFKVNQERDETWDILEVEKEYRIPVGDDFFVHMYIDLIVRIPGQGIAVVDHKFTYDFLDDDIKDIIPQLPRYIGALRADGYNVSRAYYHELRYRVTNESKQFPETRFRFTPTDINGKRVETSMLEFIGTAEEIATFKSMSIQDWSFASRRSANTVNCRSCPFKQLCKEELQDRDTTLTLEYNYRPRVHRDANN